MKTFFLLVILALCGSLKQQDKGCKNVIVAKYYKNGRLQFHIYDTFHQMYEIENPIMYKSKSWDIDSVAYEITWK